MLSMPSAALIWWRTEARATLNDLVNVHAAVGGVGPGRRYATEQVNNAYAVLLSSQFQKFCRDLHSQSADYIANLAPATIRTIVLARFTDSRKLDTGNPNPGNLGSDFGRFGLAFWAQVKAANPRNQGRKGQLEQLNLWRNAIGHHDFSNNELGGRSAVNLRDVRRWQGACNALASEFDTVLANHLANLSGAVPW
jgi:hypothetical protein